MNSGQRIFSLIVAVAIATATSVNLFADDTNAAPAGTIDQRIDQLDQEIRILKRQRELDQEHAQQQAEEVAQKAKQAPIVTAGSDGFALKSADGNSVLKLKGQLQADSRWYLDDDAHNGTDTFLIRRARPTLEGTFFRDFDFRLMPDFGNDSVALFDAYMEWRHWPWLKVRVGKFKPPVGLEQLQEDPCTEFAERGLPTDLVPNRDIGVQLGGDMWGGVVQYQVGVFNGVADGVNGGIDNGDAKDVEGRVFLEPFKKTDIEPLRGLGFGVAGTIGDQTGTATSPNLPSFKTVGQNTFFSYITSTNAPGASIANGRRIRLSPQGYYYWGPLGLLGEYVLSEQVVTRGASADRLRDTAWQVLGSFVLTGERASFKGVTPRKPFDLKKGDWGAFEVVGRISQLDVDNDAFPTFANPAVSASRATEWGVGLNWYLNGNVRLYLDYEQTAFDGGAAGGKDRDTERVVFTRAQVRF